MAPILDVRRTASDLSPLFSPLKTREIDYFDPQIDDSIGAFWTGADVVGSLFVKIRGGGASHIHTIRMHHKDLTICTFFLNPSVFSGGCVLRLIGSEPGRDCL